ncbi:PucR family transcriptional regulator [Actinoalloteichus caeruleus]|uniref:PucR family transcriptional regulator n=1 Tax=Actinoalloteichus cyanogriseus TaxID=2893586 RepID=UPI0005583DC9|nr:PucR family transcriptional regulator [Actinoalloteichus caeruleus]
MTVRGVSAAGAPGASLRQLLLALDDPLVELVAAPAGLDVVIGEVVILDPEDAPDTQRGDLILLIGARDASALPAVRAAARRGAAAVAVKVTSAGASDALRAAAVDAGVALLAVRPAARWEQVESLASGVVSRARVSADADEGEVLGDLFSTAQTVAHLTGGIVSIEDTAARVLAYSRSSGEVDELRRLSILGRQGPEPYLEMLREWGVYQRLRSGEDVVRIDERPDLGIRRRIAVGVHAGGRPLGAIWVQEGDEPLTEHAERSLLGAARVTALQLVRHRNEPSAGLRLRENLLAGLLNGRLDPSAAAGQLGVDSRRPAAVVAFASRVESPGAVVDRPELELRRDQLGNVISMHAAAFRRGALVSQLGTRTYALLPELSGSGEAAVVGLAREIISASRGIGLVVRAAVGSVVPELGGAADSRRQADRVLDAMAGDTAARVATIADWRAEVLVSETVDLLAEHPAIRDPRVTALRRHDERNNGSLVGSVVAYLESFGDVRAAARRLHVHPNTLRYRIRRAEEVSGLDLGDARQRLFTELQLRLRE